MAQQPLEIILLRQWATHLAIPIWIAGMDGNLIFYNEPAEALLGIRFDEAGEMPLDQLSEIFNIADTDGSPIPPDEIPLGIALMRRRPAHRALRYRALDGVWHDAEITAFPIEGQGGRELGAVALIWKLP